MPAPAAQPPRPAPTRAGRFRYAGVDVDEAAGTVRCRYELDGRPFTEVVGLGAGRRWGPAAHEAARLVALLAGVSYYKAGVPPVVDLDGLPVRDGEREFLRTFLVDGLGEMAWRNDLVLDDLEVVGGLPAPPAPALAVDLDRPLVPFGGGLDSLVTVELVRRCAADVALFVLQRPGLPFAGIDRAADATGLAVVRAERELDPALVRPSPQDARRWFNGHVPVTAIVSAVAVLAAVLDRRGAVVMSNEWSASSGNVAVGDRWVNHQWSKGVDFERAFRDVLAGALPGLEWFSALRPRSELWIAERFAALDRYHPVFHSCNRAFHLDPSRRLARWCGECDKCCFIDLVLAPFLDRAALEAVFDGREPLADPSLAPRFRALLATSADRKPFECVGDVAECRTAAVLAAARPDRAGTALLHLLVGELGEGAAAARADAGRLLGPLGPHHVPDAYLAAAALV